jgi:uncharacterized membrane protein YdbT with pleckstrin-like domain
MQNPPHVVRLGELAAETQVSWLHTEMAVLNVSVAVMTGGAAGLVLTALQTASGLCLILIALGASGAGASQVLVYRR